MSECTKTSIKDKNLLIKEKLHAQLFKAVTHQTDGLVFVVCPAPVALVGPLSVAFWPI